MSTRTDRFVFRDLRTVLDLVRVRRGMYFSDGFESLVAFLVGYSEAIKRTVGVDLMSLFQEHVKSVYEADFSVFWPYYLLDEIADADEERATELVFSTLNDFISKRESASSGPPSGDGEDPELTERNDS